MYLGVVESSPRWLLSCFTAVLIPLMMSTFCSSFHRQAAISSRVISSPERETKSTRSRKLDGGSRSLTPLLRSSCRPGLSSKGPNSKVQVFIEGEQFLTGVRGAVRNLYQNQRHGCSDLIHTDFRRKPWPFADELN